MAANRNGRSPAVKRIMQEMKEMSETMDAMKHSDTPPAFCAEALESDIFEWHFVLQGPAGTDFEGGLYHGRILLPPDYPFKPPSFVMLSPSGRFETNTKICLSISSHHPEHWQPSWSMRTALTALIAFFPTPSRGALGAVDLPASDRRELARQSRLRVPSVSSEERQMVMQRLHHFMLQTEDSAVSTSDNCAPSPTAALTGSEPGAPLSADGDATSRAREDGAVSASSPEGPASKAQPASPPRASEAGQATFAASGSRRRAHDALTMTLHGADSPASLRAAEKKQRYLVLALRVVDISLVFLWCLGGSIVALYLLVS